MGIYKGMQFNRWLVIEDENIPNDKSNKKQVLAECQCSKKTRKIVNLDNLRFNKSKSCGCYADEIRTKHSHSNDRLYTIHKGILARCNNPNHRDYHNYGARGIKVYQEWQDDFMTFYNWAMSHGYESNLTLERINVNGDYCPDNCTWITIAEQQKNKRDTVYVEHDGIKERLMDICIRTGIRYNTLEYRYKHNYPYEKLIATPVYKKTNRK